MFESYWFWGYIFVAFICCIQCLVDEEGEINFGVFIESLILGLTWLPLWIGAINRKLGE